MAKKFLTDEEMAALEGDNAAPDFISDEDMAALDQSSPLPQYDPIGGLESALYGVGQGVTLGHFPQVGAAVQSRSVSGPEYEAAKENIRTDIEKASVQNPSLVFGGQLLGSAVPGLGIARAIPGVSAARLAAAGALQGGLQNPGGDVGIEQLSDRAKNLGAGALMGSVLGAGASRAARSFGRSAESRGFKALGPYARQTMQNYERGRINEIGRELLDYGVITNRPRSYEGLATRAGAVKEKTGEKIGSLIDELSQYADDMTQGEVASSKSLAIPGQGVSGSAGIDRKAIASSLRGDLISSKGIPGIARRNAKLEKLISEFERGGLIPLKKGQSLKTELNKLIKWDRLPGTDIPLEEQFYRALYSKLSRGIEDSAEALATMRGGDSLANLKKLKRNYGAMSEAEKIASTREAKEFANRFISPSDYITGLGGLAIGASYGQTPEERIQNAILGLSLGALNKGARTYGNQISSKQLDNLSRLLKSDLFMKSGVLSPAVSGSLSGKEQSKKNKARLKALEE